MSAELPASDTRAAASERAGLPRRRLVAFVAVLLACIAGASWYAARVAQRVDAAAQAPSPHAEVELDALPAGGRAFLLFRVTGPGPSHGRVALEYLDAGAGPRYVTKLRCDRVHFAAGRGICLEAKRGALTTYHAHLFDRDLRVLHSRALAGTPSRARVSADGRLAAMTVFVSGHSYATPGFSTRTSIVDAASGEPLVDDLEKWPVLRDGRPFKTTDFNFWGVTFTGDGARFYATLGTDGKRLLVEGDVAARQMRVIHDKVECPSLSPDGTRIAFKRQASGAGGRIAWGVHVLDLASGSETALAAETRNVDDQVEWLSSDEITYALPDDGDGAATSSWALAADGRSAPRLLVPLAFSPAVVR